MLEQRPVSSSVRQQLDAQLPTDADFHAFCLDCFPECHRRFSKGNGTEREGEPVAVSGGTIGGGDAASGMGFDAAHGDIWPELAMAGGGVGAAGG